MIKSKVSSDIDFLKTRGKISFVFLPLRLVFSTSDRSDLFSSSRSLSFFCKESSGKKVGVDTLLSAGRTLETHERDV